jgi:hypothetical protein
MKGLDRIGETRAEIDHLVDRKRSAAHHCIECLTRRIESHAPRGFSIERARIELGADLQGGREARNGQRRDPLHVSDPAPAQRWLARELWRKLGEYGSAAIRELERPRELVAQAARLVDHALIGECDWWFHDTSSSAAM